MIQKKIREEVSECSEKCPMYYPIMALNSFVRDKGSLMCPISLCKSIVQSMDTNGNIVCSKTGSVGKNIDGFFDDNGLFVRWVPGSKDEKGVKSTKEKIEKIEKTEKTDVIVCDLSDIVSIINSKLNEIEGYFKEKLGDAFYFFKQCREIDKKEKFVCFFNTKNNIVQQKELDELGEKEREIKELKAHEYRIPFDKFVSMDSDQIKQKLDTFYLTLYKSIQDIKKLSCNECRWEVQGVKGRAMDCLNCSRNTKSKIPTDNRVDNYS